MLLIRTGLRKRLKNILAWFRESIRMIERKSNLVSLEVVAVFEDLDFKGGGR